MKNLLAPIMLAGVMSVSFIAAPFAQNYPSKPVQVIVPYAAGGGTDIAVRTVFDQISKDLGQQFVVLNRPGAGTTIGVQQTASAKPDGYTVGFIDPAFAINTTLLPSVPYDPKSLQTVSLMTTTPLALAVPADRPWKSLKELIADIKANPGKFDFGSPGIGSAGHLATEQFRSEIKANVVHIPYKGGGPALIDLIGGQIDILLIGPNSLLPHIESGKLRVLAVTGNKRSGSLPNIPTFAESGLPSVDGQTYAGLLAPAKVPEEIVKTLHAAIVKALANPKVRERLDTLGLIPVGSSPKEFAEFLEADKKRWATVIKEAKVSPKL